MIQNHSQDQEYSQYNSKHQPHPPPQSQSHTQSYTQWQSDELQNLSPSKPYRHIRDREREGDRERESFSSSSYPSGVLREEGTYHHDKNSYTNQTYGNNNSNYGNDNNNSRSNSHTNHNNQTAGHNQLLRFKIKMPSNSNQHGDRGTGSGSFAHTTSQRNGLSLTLPVVKDLNRENFLSGEAAPSLLRQYEPGGSNLYNL